MTADVITAPLIPVPVVGEVAEVASTAIGAAIGAGESIFAGPALDSVEGVGEELENEADKVFAML